MGAGPRVIAQSASTLKPLLIKENLRLHKAENLRPYVRPYKNPRDNPRECY